MKYALSGIAIVAGILLTLVVVFQIPWATPPIESEQTGYRGTGIADLKDAGEAEASRAAAEVPPPPYELVVGEDAPRAGDFYENVQVLSDISTDEFNYLMVAITEWVSPEEGCNYCHIPENLASDDIYTKRVSRRMLQMNRAINQDWRNHVADTGVTCYTCHRGNPVPENIWFPPGPDAGEGYMQNMASATVGLTSLPSTPFADYLTGEYDAEAAGAIRVQSDQMLTGGMEASMQDAEATYGLMIHLSEALGVNCTYCHNSRAFGVWDQSSAARVTAYHGLDMVRALNGEYVMPLVSELPDNRLSPHGDAPGVNCATCHAGANKPLYGAQMAADYPSLMAGSAQADADADTAAAEEQAME